jgi:cell division protein FtsZ
MKDKGIAHIGIGTGKGDDKASEAVQMAVTSPLLETTITGASHVIINISGDISLMEANDAASYVQELAGDGANIIFGARYDDTYPDECTITVMATGLDSQMDDKTPKTMGFGYQATKTMSFGKSPEAQAAPKTTFNFNKSVKPEVHVENKSIKIPDFLQKK